MSRLHFDQFLPTMATVNLPVKVDLDEMVKLKQRVDKACKQFLDKLCAMYKGWDDGGRAGYVQDTIPLSDDSISVYIFQSSDQESRVVLHTLTGYVQTILLPTGNDGVDVLRETVDMDRLKTWRV